MTGQSGYHVEYNANVDATLLRVAEQVFDIPIDQMTTAEKEILYILYRANVITPDLTPSFAKET